MHRKIGKDRACGSGDMLADRQTDAHIQTHTQTCLSQYFANAPAGEITNLQLAVDLSPLRLAVRAPPGHCYVDRNG